MEGPSFYNKVFRKNWCHFSAPWIKNFGGNPKTKSGSTRLTFPCGILSLWLKLSFGRKVQLKNRKEPFWCRIVNLVVSVFVFQFSRKILMEGPSFYNEVFRKNWCYFCTFYVASFVQKVKNCTLIDYGILKCYDLRMIYAHFMNKECFRKRFIKEKVAEKIWHFQITVFWTNQTTNEI